MPKTLKIVTFGIKHRRLTLTLEDRLVDCRQLRNPYSEPALRPLDGRHPRVQAYVAKDSQAAVLVDMVSGHAGKDGLTVLFCTGGRHRSVAIAEMAAAKARFLGVEVTLSHRELSG